MKRNRRRRVIPDSRPNENGTFGRVIRDPVPMKKTKKLVLVVTADAKLGEIYAKRLELRGFVAKIMSKAIKLASVIKEKNPVCVVFDFDVPGEDSYKILEEMRAGGDSTLFVGLALRGSREEIARARELGVHSYFLKLHSDPSQVIDIIEQEIKK